MIQKLTPVVAAARGEACQVLVDAFSSCTRLQLNASALQGHVVHPHMHTVTPHGAMNCVGVCVCVCCILQVRVISGAPFSACIPLCENLLCTSFQFIVFCPALLNILG